MDCVRKKMIGKVIVYVVIILVTLINLFPYIWMAVNSFRDSAEPLTSSLIPHSWSLKSYIDIFTAGSQQTANTLVAMKNSFMVSALSTLLTSFLAILSGYGFSRFRFRGRNFLMAFLINMRTFPGILLAISLFVMAGKVGLFDTFLVLILANTMMNLPFAIWNNISIIDSVPMEIEESAMVDGLKRVPAIMKIVFPIAAPGIVGTIAYTFILTWNEYLFATNFISSASKEMITTRIAASVGQFNTDFSLLLSTSMLASLPLIILFLVIQKYIVAGLAMGSVKG